MENYYLMAISGLFMVLGVLLSTLFFLNYREKRIRREHEKQILDLQQKQTQQITQLQEAKDKEISDKDKIIANLQQKISEKKKIGGAATIFTHDPDLEKCKAKLTGQ